MTRRILDGCWSTQGLLDGHVLVLERLAPEISELVAPGLRHRRQHSCCKRRCVDSDPLSQRSAHAEQYAQTKTNTNRSPDPNRYRRRCPDPNARIQKFIHYMAIAAICDSRLSLLSLCLLREIMFDPFWYCCCINK